MSDRENTRNFRVESFSQGKKAKGNRRNRANEDRVVVTDDYLAVVDGATANPPIPINGMTSGEFASDTIARSLRNAPKGLSGKPLVDHVTREFQQELDGLPNETKEALRQNPHAKPYASMAVASVADETTTVTQVGDVGFRVNGGPTQDNPKDIDRIHAQQRVRAIQEAQRADPRLSTDELRKIGAEAIRPSLQRQPQDLQNKPQHPLGYGAIDGTPVHSQFIKSHPPIPTDEIDTLEIYSDGYFKPGEKPTIRSWEQSFREVEKEDPEKTGKYASVKGSTDKTHTDDRTILIAKRKQRRG